MAAFKPRVISLTKKPGQTFGFFLRVEKSEEGHLIRCLEMGGPAELAGMRDGDRILRVNGTFVDELPHTEVVELIRNSGVSVTFHILDGPSYQKAKVLKENLSDPQNIPAANGAAKEEPKAKLCYLVKSSSGFGFSIRSDRGEDGLFVTEVTAGGVAEKAGLQVHDRLIEVNGENIENSSHEEVVEKIKHGGSTIMFLLVDEETDKFYKSKQARVRARSATVKYLPRQPRLVNVNKGSDGYGFLLKEEPNTSGHFIMDVDKSSPAEKAGLKEMDRVVAVNGKEVDNCSHDEVVDMIKLGGDKTCFLVVDKKTDQMYKQGKVSPMLFWQDMKGSNSPPSYTEAIKVPPTERPSTPVAQRTEELRPKLCRMDKTSAGFGFHLNGIEGISGQYITEVVKGGAADKAGLQDGDVVVQVNGVNVEQSTHPQVVEMIRDSGSSLEMLVASKEVYNKLKASGVTITPLLLAETSRDQLQTVDNPETPTKENEKEASPDTSPKQQRQRAQSLPSSSSEESEDERL